ncbi:Ribosomal RNA small subunit methyltransferase G [Burkholderiales bacterium]|nr:Ribosomal RNA small subunit methyltransferase G [Burkholderiales bacterium]
MTGVDALEATALDAGLARLGVALPAGGRAKLAAHLALLAKWNRTYNLTAIREPERMVTHHALDSLAVLPHLPARGGISVLDVGSGGGLPGIPIAIARPDARVALVDSNHKKATFLAQAAIELSLPNVEAVASRVEDYAPARKFDVVISRAFSDLATFARLGRTHLAAGGRLYAMKGVHPDEELDQLPGDVEVVAAHRLDVPGLDGARHLIVMRVVGVLGSEP